MAAIEGETEIETNLKPARYVSNKQHYLSIILRNFCRSMAQLYSNEDLTQETYSAPASLKPGQIISGIMWCLR